MTFLNRKNKSKLFFRVENVVSDGDLQLILKNVTDLEIFKPAIEFTKCIIIISNEVFVSITVTHNSYFKKLHEINLIFGVPFLALKGSVREK